MSMNVLTKIGEEGGVCVCLSCERSRPRISVLCVFWLVPPQTTPPRPSGLKWRSPRGCSDQTAELQEFLLAPPQELLLAPPSAPTWINSRVLAAFLQHRRPRRQQLSPPCPPSCLPTLRSPVMGSLVRLSAGLLRVSAGLWGGSAGGSMVAAATSSRRTHVEL